jgi:hypothetical protein
LSDIFGGKNLNLTFFDLPIWGNMNLYESLDIEGSGGSEAFAIFSCCHQGVDLTPQTWDQWSIVALNEADTFKSS